MGNAKNNSKPKCAYHVVWLINEEVGVGKELRLPVEDVVVLVAVVVISEPDRWVGTPGVQHLKDSPGRLCIPHQSKTPALPALATPKQNDAWC